MRGKLVAIAMLALTSTGLHAQGKLLGSFRFDAPVKAQPIPQLALPAPTPPPVWRTVEMLASDRSIDCGMPTPGDARVDPKMTVPAPSTPQQIFTARVIQATPCPKK